MPEKLEKNPLERKAHSGKISRLLILIFFLYGGVQGKHFPRDPEMMGMAAPLLIDRLKKLFGSRGKGGIEMNPIIIMGRLGGGADFVRNKRRDQDKIPRVKLITALSNGNVADASDIINQLPVADNAGIAGAAEVFLLMPEAVDMKGYFRKLL